MTNAEAECYLQSASCHLLFVDAGTTDEYKQLKPFLLNLETVLFIIVSLPAEHMY